MLTQEAYMVKGDYRLGKLLYHTCTDSEKNIRKAERARRIPLYWIGSRNHVCGGIKGVPPNNSITDIVSFKEE